MPTSPEAHKQQLLTDLERAREAVIAAAAALPSEKRDEVFLGVWNIKNLLAHLIGWDYTNLQAIEDVLAGRLPRFYEHHDHDWRAYNAQLVRTYGHEDWQELVESAADSHRQLLAAVRALPAEELGRDRGIRFRGWKVTIARLLQAEAEDEATHAAQVKGFSEEFTPCNAPSNN